MSLCLYIKVTLYLPCRDPYCMKDNKSGPSISRWLVCTATRRTVPSHPGKAFPRRVSSGGHRTRLSTPSGVTSTESSHCSAEHCSEASEGSPSELSPIRETPYQIVRLRVLPGQNHRVVAQPSHRALNPHTC